MRLRLVQRPTLLRFSAVGMNGTMTVLCPSPINAQAAIPFSSPEYTTKCVIYYIVDIFCQYCDTSEKSINIPSSETPLSVNNISFYFRLKAIAVPVHMPALTFVIRNSMAGISFNISSF